MIFSTGFCQYSTDQEILKSLYMSKRVIRFRLIWSYSSYSGSGRTVVLRGRFAIDILFHQFSLQNAVLFWKLIVLLQISQIVNSSALFYNILSSTY